MFLRPRPRDFPSEPRRNRSESESLMGVDGLWIVLYSVEIEEELSSLGFGTMGPQLTFFIFFFSWGKLEESNAFHSVQILHCLLLALANNV